MTAHTDEIVRDLSRAGTGQATPEQVLKSIVDGINTGNLDALMPLYDARARCGRCSDLAPRTFP